MNKTERRKQLLAWLEKKGSLSTREIAEHFNVTKMTVHRDLSLLKEQKALRRIHGGVLANPAPANRPGPASADMAVASQGQCLICFRSATQHLIYSLTLTNGESMQACCPHCGISAHLIYQDRVAMALTADYLTGRQHPVQISTFLLGSAAAPCCRPSILTFENEDMARRFQAGFGGKLGRLKDAVEYLQQELSVNPADSCPNCTTE